MTIYKPLRTLAQGAAEIAVKMSTGKPIITRQTVNNGAIDVPAVLFDVVTVTRENIDATVIKDGLIKHSDVYR